MKENFTAKQKEVVARKMGYNGPMQMFDEFLMSRPSDAQRYASITSKFAENMAKGGMVGYKDLAAKGRNGDTMLAHITPEEAALLKARGGAGTINPETGLPEFYGQSQMKYLAENPVALEPLPVLAQAFDLAEFQYVPDKLNTTTVPATSMGGMGSMSPAYEKVSDNYLQYADRAPALGMGGGRQIQGYSVPTEQTFQGKPLEAKYDAKGNFQYIGIAGGDVLIPDPNQPNIASSPRFNKTGGIVDYGVFDLSKRDTGSFGSMVREIGTELGPIALAALAGYAFNPAGGNILGLGGAGSTVSGVSGAAAAETVGSAAKNAMFGAAGYGAPVTAAELAAAEAAAAAAAPGLGLKAGIGTGLDLASTIGTTVGDATIKAGIGSGLNLAAPTGGGLGLTAASAGASTIGQGLGETLSSIDTGIKPFSGSNSFTDTIKDLVKDTKEEKKENQPKDLSSAIGLLLGLLGERNPATRGERTYAEGGVVEPAKPIAPVAPTVTKAKASTAKATKAKIEEAAPITTAVASKDVTATGVLAPSTVTEDKIAADAAQTKLAEYLTGVKAEEGVVSEEAQAEAATVVPTETDVGKEPAAQGTATFVKEPTARVLQEGEVVSGSTVDQQQVEETLAKTEAAQGVVTEDMTTQGQLNKLLTNFDAGNPPPWAASSMRAVTAQLASRGLGASSLAGQAVIQATLEAALPVAAADAKVFEQMGLQNLSNRQQTAMVLGEQRAKFLGQEFDQNFQTKVLNAARIADIADKNFTADVTIAIENARLTSSMDLQNLSNRQALILAKTAQVASLETTNLNNRQQVAVENARAFLTLDVKNLDNRQQTALFKAKEISDSIITDTAAANAARATNAANALDADKINAQLALSASQYNAAEKNKVAIFNKSAADELIKFNVQEANNRAEFNANLATQVNVANSKLLADVSMANTREKNAVAAINAKNATDLSAAKYAQESQAYRDQIETAWKTSENSLDRANEIAKVTMTTNATKYAGDAAADASYYAALGSLSASLVSSSAGSKVVSSIVDVGSSLINKGIDKALSWLD